MVFGFGAPDLDKTLDSFVSVKTEGLPEEPSRLAKGGLFAYGAETAAPGVTEAYKYFKARLVAHYKEFNQDSIKALPYALKDVNDYCKQRGLQMNFELTLPQGSFGQQNKKYIDLDKALSKELEKGSNVAKLPDSSRTKVA